MIQVEVIKIFDINIYYFGALEKKNYEFYKLNGKHEVHVHYVGQNNFEMRLYDEQGIEIQYSVSMMDPTFNPKLKFHIKCP